MKWIADHSKADCREKPKHLPHGAVVQFRLFCKEKLDVSPRTLTLRTETISRKGPRKYSSHSKVHVDAGHATWQIKGQGTNTSAARSRFDQDPVV